MSIRSAEGEEFFQLDESVARRVISEGVPIVLSRHAGSVLAIKEDDTFLVCDVAGNVSEENTFGLGLYHRDTRFMSLYTLQLSGTKPILLSSSAESAYVSHVDLTNTDVWFEDAVVIPQQTLNVRRMRVIGQRLHERIRVRNYASRPVEVRLELRFGADFADVFEVRGLRRTLRGTQLQPKPIDRGVVFAYLGQDDLFRQTRIEFSEQPDGYVEGVDEIQVWFSLSLKPHQTRLLEITVDPRVGEEVHSDGDFDEVLHRIRRSYEDWQRSATRIRTGTDRFNVLIDRGIRDIRALRTRTPHGDFVAAGVPWAAAPFARDGLLAAYEMLSINPDVAADALRVAARLQGRRVDEWRDEEPGKIFHELRQGELALAGVVPHAPYFGSVDATPLFVMLAGAHYRWTNDVSLFDELRPNLDAALAWMDAYGDVDGDGFVEYFRRSPRGLENQGWKDSGGAVVHPDGTPAKPPIALAEVQGYVYMAKLRMAEMVRARGEDETAERLEREAADLRRRYNEAFWMPGEEYYAFALDGDKQPVPTITSNPGHGLYCDIIDAEKAPAVVRRLFQADMFSGWGIRTMSKGEPAYNPMSHHNGSVWPHDNAVIAAGLKRYGFHEETNRVATALFEAAVHSQYQRLPELFCGFTRRTPSQPVAYPVACSPQAWAAGSVFILLQAMLGISARAHDNLLTVNVPMLPAWLDSVEVRDMRVGASRISMLFTRDGDMTSFSLLDRQGDVRVVMEE